MLVLAVYVSGVVLALVVGYLGLRHDAKIDLEKAKKGVVSIFVFSLLSWLAVALYVMAIIYTAMLSDLENQARIKKKNEDLDDPTKLTEGEIYFEPSGGLSDYLDYRDMK